MITSFQYKDIRTIDICVLVAAVITAAAQEEQYIMIDGKSGDLTIKNNIPQGDKWLFTIYPSYKTAVGEYDVLDYIIQPHKTGSSSDKIYHIIAKYILEKWRYYLNVEQGENGK